MIVTAALLLLAAGPAGSSSDDDLQVHLTYLARNGLSVPCGTEVGLLQGPLSGASAIAMGMNSFKNLDQMLQDAMSGNQSAVPKTTAEMEQKNEDQRATIAAATLVPISSALRETVDAVLTWNEGKHSYRVKSGTVTYSASDTSTLDAGEHVLWDKLSASGTAQLHPGSNEIVVTFDDGREGNLLDPSGKGGESDYKIEINVAPQAVMVGQTGWDMGKLGSIHRTYTENATVDNITSVAGPAPPQHGGPCKVALPFTFSAWDQEVKDKKADGHANWLTSLGSPTQVTWSIAYPIEAEIDPVPDGWLPSGPPPSQDAQTLPQSAAGKTVTLHMRTTKPKGLKADWKITIDATDLPGISGNSLSQDTDADFKIRQSDNDTDVLDLSQDLRDTSMTVSTKKPADKVDLTLTAMDYAAYARVKAEITVNGGSPIPVKVKGHPDQDHVTLPVVAGEESHVSKSWAQSHGVADADPTDDEDDTPKGDGKGDGFTVFEEYRGFFVQSQGQTVHQRLDPRVKDLFVRDKTGNADVDAGISGFQTASGIQVWRLDDAHAGDDLVVNKSQIDARAGDQHAVKLDWFTFHDRPGQKTLAQTISKEGDLSLPTSPADVQLVRVSDSCKSGCDGFSAAITHELGHALHANHHGGGIPGLGDPPGDYDVEIASVTGGCPKLTIPVGTQARVAAYGGSQSGDVGCPMRYQVADLYEACVAAPGATIPDDGIPRHSSSGTTCWHLLDGTLPPGTGDANIVLKVPPKPNPVGAYCTTATGSGYAGNAAPGFGNCAAQLHVSDLTQPSAGGGKPGRGPLPPACSAH